MEKLFNNSWIECSEEELSINDIYRIPVGGGGFQQQQYNPIPKSYIEKSWRDDQLFITDSMLQPDRTNPSYQEILDYRQALKDYPQQPDFPNGTRPTL